MDTVADNGLMELPSRLTSSPSRVGCAAKVGHAQSMQQTSVANLEWFESTGVSTLATGVQAAWGWSHKRHAAVEFNIAQCLTFAHGRTWVDQVAGAYGTAAAEQGQGDETTLQ
jgi:hypothetical protein